jgi:hypothetical protein
MKILKVFLSLLLFFIFFVWGTNLNPLIPLKIHFPLYHATFFVIFISITFFLLKKTTPISVHDYLLLKYKYCIFPLLGFISALLISLFVFQGIPHIQDSINYFVMAQNFAAGQFHHSMHDHYEFFRLLYLIPDGESVKSLFMPGFSIFLTPFVYFNIPFLANPILTAFNIYMAGKIAEILFDEKTSFFTMLFLLISSFIIIMGGTFMAHSFCAAMTLSVVYSFIVSLKSEKFLYPLICGVSMGFLVLTRPQNALFLTVPISLIVLFKIRNRTILHNSLKAFIFFLPFLVWLFFINYSYTGDILTFKQDVYFNYSEPRDFCHRFGIGSGCPNSNWERLPYEGLTWEHAFFITFKRLSPLIMNLLLHPLMFIFSVLAFAFVKRRDHLNNLIFLFMLFVFAASGYFFFYFDGNVFGPRYYYETSFFIVICIAYGFNLFLSQKKLFFKSFAVSILAASFLLQTFIVYPKLISTYSLGFWCVDAKLKDAVKEKGITNGVVFVSPEEMYGSGFILMDHTDYDSNDIIYVRDLGASQNQRLFPYYGGRSFYKAQFEKGDRNTKHPVITEIIPGTDPGVMRLQMEYKKYPLTGVPDYCNVFPERDYLDQHITVALPYNAISKDMELFFCRFKSKDQFYDFGQYFYISGNYEITVSGVTGETGRFKIYIDDRYVHTVDFSKVRETKMGYFSFETFINEGFRNIKIEPSEIRDQYEYFFIDYIDFVIKKK